jgi:Fic family protein
MSARSEIEWTDSTWNPVRGCTKVSPGCAHCYGEVFAERFRGVPGHPGQPPRVRFRPVSAADTPAAVEELCRAYRTTIDQSLAPPLVAVAALILDFLCIHPFRDGNGRVSRLLTLLALYQHGFEVGRYISLERLIEEEKRRYYETLESSSAGWHEGTLDIHPWLLFFLSILGAATREFEQRASGQKRPRGAKRALVEQAIDAFPGAFSLADLERACPGVSRDMIRRVLSDLRKAGRLSCTGRGPGARWGKRVIPPRGCNKGCNVPPARARDSLEAPRAVEGTLRIEWVRASR